MSRKLILVALTILFLDPGLECFTGIAAFRAQAAEIVAGEGSELIAQRRGRRRRRRNKGKRQRRQRNPNEAASQGSGTGGAAGAGGASIHAAQEGEDEPYAYEVALLSDFSRTTRTTGDFEGGSADYELFLRGLYIISASIEAGIDFDFAESSAKAGDDTLTTRSYGIAGVGVFNLGNLDEDTGLPYIYASLGFRGGSIPSGDDTTSTQGFSFGAGGGYRYFVDSNVALQGELGLQYGTEQADDADESTTVFKINLLKVGFSLFI